MALCVVARHRLQGRGRLQWSCGELRRPRLARWARRNERRRGDAGSWWWRRGAGRRRGDGGARCGHRDGRPSIRRLDGRERDAAARCERERCRRRRGPRRRHPRTRRLRRAIRSSSRWVTSGCVSPRRIARAATPVAFPNPGGDLDNPLLLRCVTYGNGLFVAGGHRISPRPMARPGPNATTRPISD